MSLNKRVTLQLAQRRAHLKNQLVAKQEALSRKEANPPVFTPGVSAGDRGCGCPDGFIDDCNTIPWQQRILVGGNGNVNVIVDGSKATFDTPISDTRNIAEWVDTWANGASLPIEVLYRIKFRWDWDSDSWDFLVQLDAQPDPPGSGLWAYLGFDTTDTGTFGSHTLSIRAQTSTSEPVGSADAIVWTSSTLAEQQDAVAELDVRFRVESGAIKARIWEVGTSEPGAWTFDDSGDLSALDGQLVSLGLTIFGIDNEGGEGGSKNRFEIESIQITEGCETVSCLETFTRVVSGDLGNSEFGVHGMTCIDTFTRTVGEGWGISELNGEEWFGANVADWDTTGVSGRIQNISLNPSDWQYLESVSLAQPVELLWTFSATELASGSSVAIGLGIRTSGGPFGDDNYATLHVNILDQVFRIQLTTETSGGSLINMYNTPAEWSGKTLFIRVRVEGTTLYAKVWKTIDDEPSAWSTTFTGTLSGEPAALRVHAISGDGPGYHRILINEVEIIDGCVDCDPEVVGQNTLVIGEPSSGTSDGSLLVSRLMVMGVCIRITPDHYRLPTAAQHVSTVSIDGLRITGWMWESPRDIFLPASVDADSRVYARYLQA